MRFVDLIEKKKAGHPLSREELHFFIQGYIHGDIPDYQVSALLMAICFTSMNSQETAWLCEEMINSGDCLDLSSCGGVVCDKHSTGGVGDKTTLALAPMVAACGVKIAKMSGRGLGHTGGTLDKLESIPGLKIEQTQEAFLKQVKNIGLAIISQSNQLVPADKLLYALRDVTATVDSIPLIAASIMSKKIACGADCILLDVKYGNGAFMKDADSAKQLAEEMIAIGKHFHKDTKAIISNMQEPLGNAIGNALEVKEAISTLQGKGPDDFSELCLQAGSIMLKQAKIANDDTARAMLLEAIQSGRALQIFKDMVNAQHGDVAVIDNLELLPKAKYVFSLLAKDTGFLHELHAEKLGLLAMHLGAGRATKDDTIDPSVGIVLNKKIGHQVKQNEILAYVHANHELSKEWIRDFYSCYKIDAKKINPLSIIHEIIR